ncbi:hypothetical protein AB3U99_22240 [Niallia sp. JL1B1071]|uniref:hypothetical protein n=1 Tax=Niallia tiangongensis TaxID=3237105 RepID=UPI0037DD6120
MMWFPYIYLIFTLIIIWFMPKRLTKVEIYVTWFVVALINLSSDIILSFVFHMYELGPKGVQLSVHLIELTLGSIHGILYLNFMPHDVKKFIPYFFAWFVYSILLESILIYFGFITYSGWSLWYSGIYYVIALIYTRWHLNFIRSGK